MDQYIDFISANPLLSGAWIVLAGMFIYSFIGPRFRGFSLVSPHELTMLVNRDDATVIDIRAADTFRKGHITGAKNIVASKITESNRSELEKLAGKPIIVVCEAGMTANKACATLKQLGLEQIYSLRGGMNEWRQANLPVTGK